MTLDSPSIPDSASIPSGPPQAGRVIVRAKEIRKLTGIPNSTRADKENPKSPRFDPTWPKKIRLGARSTGYFLDEVLAWLESQRQA